MIRIIVSLVAPLIGQGVCSYGHAPEGGPLGQPAFHVCAKPITGVTYLIHDGLDADHGAATNQHGVVQVLIGRPSAFFDNRFVCVAPRSGSRQAQGHRIVLPESIPREMSLVGTLGSTGEERVAALYGYSPDGAGLRGAQDPILVLLQAGKGAGNLELMAAVGEALYRCD
ncbi:MAG: hypothetical protein ACTHNM_05625 [Dyella sp.]|uniref:hypothetical protein n=1 Tax=Dyella sp. TaxID=1869338 RepID=UPI003F7E1BC0